MYGCYQYRQGIFLLPLREYRNSLVFPQYRAGFKLRELIIAFEEDFWWNNVL